MTKTFIELEDLEKRIEQMRPNVSRAEVLAMVKEMQVPKCHNCKTALNWHWQRKYKYAGHKICGTRCFEALRNRAELVEAAEIRR